MADLFSERHLREVLNRCLPEGETLRAGVYGTTLQINRKKTSFFDVYIGLTEGYLLVAECEERVYLSEFYRVPDLRRTVAEDLGTCIPLPDIRHCGVKTGLMGQVVFSLDLKDGSFLKFQIPKRAGTKNGIPRQLEDREKIRRAA